MTDRMDELRSEIARRVAAGFDNRDEIVDRGREYACYCLERPDIATAAVGITDEELAEHHRVQRCWTRPTDCDRLDRAFAELEEEGIFARQNFTCCSTCGHAQLRQETTTAQQAGIAVVGYVFYHEQDTERAVFGDGVYLGFGAVADGTESIRNVGRRVVRALEHNGLTALWNGSYTDCIRVQLDWKRWRDG